MNLSMGLRANNWIIPIPTLPITPIPQLSRTLKRYNPPG